MPLTAPIQTLVDKAREDNQRHGEALRASMLALATEFQQRAAKLLDIEEYTVGDQPAALVDSTIASAERLQALSEQYPGADIGIAFVSKVIVNGRTLPN